MSLFQTSIKIQPQEIEQIVKKHWNIILGKIIKGSQNHTFEGSRTLEGGKQEKFSVRVTPDPGQKHRKRIQNEIHFVRYLNEHKLNRLRPVVQMTGTDNEYIYIDEKFIICVFEWARGQMLNFVEFQWMLNEEVVKQWGRFFANLHKISRKYEQQHPEIAKSIQRWDEIHYAVLKGTQPHKDDQIYQQNIQHYGVLHGDLNCSNYFYDKSQGVLNVFDTDQIQRGFFLWDVSQAVFSVYMLQNAGMPVVGTPVPQANRKQFQQWIVQGYESVAGEGSVDLQRLDRMVLMKKEFYRKFCTRAVEEGNIPPDMKPFIEYIANKLGK